MKRLLLAGLLVVSSASAQTLPPVHSPDLVEGGGFGRRVANVGDVTGDGVTDLLVGAHHAPYEGYDQVGRAYLVDGRTGYVIYGFRPRHLESPTLFGADVAGLGDVTGDGVPDLGIGAAEEGDSGAVYVIDGARGTTVRVIPRPVPGAFGHALATTGDVTGDGVPDLVVGAYKTSWSTGAAYVYDGATGDLVHTLSSPAPQLDGRFGRTVAGGLDVTGDGISDWAVAATFNDENGGMLRDGRVYLYDGATGALARTLASPMPGASGAFGVSVRLCSDMTGDGRAEMLVGASREDGAGVQNAGRAYLFDGASGDTLFTLTSPRPEEDGWLGEDATCLPDVDGDGVPDVAISAPGETAGAFRAGVVYVVSGATGRFLSDPISPQATAEGRFGITVASVVSETDPRDVRLAVGADDEPVRGVAEAGVVHRIPVVRTAVSLEESALPSRDVSISAPYPNPAGAAFSVDVTLAHEAAVSLRLIDALGRTVMTTSARPLSPGRHSLSLDTAGLATGVYTVVVMTDGERAGAQMATVGP